MLKLFAKESIPLWIGALALPLVKSDWLPSFYKGIAFSIFVVSWYLFFRVFYFQDYSKPLPMWRRVVSFFTLTCVFFWVLYGVHWGLS